MEQTVSIIVRGTVQGVFYRQSTKVMASQLGITGQVKNERDGSVHIVASGSEDQLKQLIDWCYKGPAGAVVNSVKTEIIPFQDFEKFIIDRL